jgi:glycosyltransferase involved in cell wall biosynthesis
MLTDSERQDPVAATPDAPLAVSYVVPAHNSAEIIRETVEVIAERLRGTNAEIIVAENGSSDDTIGVVREIERTWRHETVRLRLLSTPKGMGNALRAGIAASEGERIILTADDLPFGFDDLDAAEQVDVSAHRVMIGSKDHPESVLSRPGLRRLMTWGFKVVRRILLGMRTGDPQGTFVLDGKWARSVAERLREGGFLMTTELAYIAELHDIRPVEVPVRLRETDRAHRTRVRIVRDVTNMVLGMVALRRRRAELSAPVEG